MKKKYNHNKYLTANKNEEKKRIRITLNIRKRKQIKRIPFLPTFRRK